MPKGKSTLSKIGTFLHAIADPQWAQSMEQDYKRQVYGHPPANTELLKNQMYRLMNENANLVGFGWQCGCSSFYQILDINLWLGKEHKCPACGQKFDVLKAAGIKSDTPVSAWCEMLAKLPIRPRVSTFAQQRGPIDTWQTNTTDQIGYEQGDPGSSGPGFGMGR